MRAHDLLWLRTTAIAAGAPLPDWAEAAWPVVVRRAEPGRQGLVAVGLRGRARNQRHAAWVALAQVMRRCTPEALARERGWARCPGSGLACLDALARIAPMLDAAGLTWGPTGGVGFALASGAAVLHQGSDLDLLVRAPRPFAERELGLLRTLRSHAGCRLDVQIDTGCGGFALDEWLAGRRTVLLKTANGPRLVSDPWQPQKQECPA
ncbi:MAG TPA: malonate decarboxylase holo-ACP synthase [Thauera sp.]|uniref:malonate decarboxylase holo-ACP synthase n=1 Tax=Thauera sp. TaxID=1905334 RepID=UPI002C9330E4|nr:malonate decarboxylase holo-ACP synthase [Thauera sp.]HRP22616.1 malonate decarboxylase holo-ACP synthase [Thauera sp.]HRP64900.1 malonate decarboxylase holo-ACP synthase [Thauera sp.]